MKHDEPLSGPPLVPPLAIGTPEDRMLHFLIDLYSLPDFVEFTRGTRPNTDERRAKLSALHALLCTFWGAHPSLLADLEPPSVDRLNLGSYAMYIRTLTEIAVTTTKELNPSALDFEILGKILDSMKRVCDEGRARDVCRKFSLDLSKIQIAQVKQELHLRRISAMLATADFASGKVFDLRPNDKSGANDGFIATNRANAAERYYIKTFSQSLTEHTGSTDLDPREAILYKILESLGFGPKTEFLAREYSSGSMAGSSGYVGGNYVVTKDLCCVDTGEVGVLSKHYFVDGDDSPEARQAFDEALSDEYFVTQLYVLAAINRIFLIRDTFGDNYGNYGVLKTTKGDGAVHYELKLVDHMPIVRNGLVEAELSPGRSLVYEVLDRGRHKEGHSSLRAFMEKERREHVGVEAFFSSYRRGYKERVSAYFRALPIRPVLEASAAEVTALIRNAPSLFGGEASDNLTDFITRLQRNLERFEQGYLAPSASPDVQGGPS